MTDANTEAEHQSLIRSGENCWRVAPASRVAVLIDTAEYFAALKAACEQARHSVFILGWDFDRRELLGREADAPSLEDFLCGLLADRPNLNIYLLLWDFHFVYAAEREWFQAWKLRLNGIDRLHIQFDGAHPSGGSQHQKLVVVDDRVAFCGGIDLSRWRWDTPEHKARDPRRTDPDGNDYPPFHDAMMLVEGDAAAALGRLARDRWADSGAGDEAAGATGSPGDCWPTGVEPLFRGQPIAIARTLPAYGERCEVREVERLYLDAIASAQRYLYFENQYFTSRVLTEALAGRLAEEGGPDVLLVLPRHTGGWLEQATMDALRADCLARLQQADQGARLRVLYPSQPGLRENECISVHSKLLIVDDRFVCLGSANTSDRSMGLDSECNLALEAPDSEQVPGLLHRFLSEHLDCEAEAVRAARAQHDRLGAAVDSLRRAEGRSLRDLDESLAAPPMRLIEDADLVDPGEPIDPEYLMHRAVPRRDKDSAYRGLYGFLALVLVLLALGAAWRWTPLSEWLTPERLTEWLKWFENPVVRALAVTGALTLASLLMVPMSLLVVVCAILLGPWLGFGCAMLGALLSGWLAFLGGKAMGGRVLQRFDGTQIHRLSERLSRRGIMAVAMLRLVPVAPYTVVNVVAGASHLRTGQFMVGSLIGLLPGIGALTLFSGSLYQAIIDPSAESFVILGVIALVVVAGILALRRLLRSS